MIVQLWCTFSLKGSVGVLVRNMKIVLIHSYLMFIGSNEVQIFVWVINDGECQVLGLLHLLPWNSRHGKYSSELLSWHSSTPQPGSLLLSPSPDFTLQMVRVSPSNLVLQAHSPAEYVKKARGTSECSLSLHGHPNVLLRFEISDSFTDLTGYLTPD